MEIIRQALCELQIDNVYLELSVMLGSAGNDLISGLLQGRDKKISYYQTLIQGISKRLPTAERRARFRRDISDAFLADCGI